MTWISDKASTAEPMKMNGLVSAIFASHESTNDNAGRVAYVTRYVIQLTHS